MIDQLEPEIIQAVLGFLGEWELGAPRCVCKAFDAAARALCTTLTFTPATATGVRPDWRRFPNAHSLLLYNFTPYSSFNDDEEEEPDAIEWALRRCFQEPLPRRMRDLRIDDCNVACDTLALIAARMPGLARAALPRELCALGVHSFVSSAPQLEALDVNIGVRAEIAAVLAQRPRLVSLTCSTVAAAAWALLPCSQLTALRTQSLEGADLSRLCFSRLARLQIYTLPFEIVENLAAAAPALRLLSCEPGGVWGPTHASFPALASLSINFATVNFAGARLASLCPALEHLDLKCDFRYPCLTLLRGVTGLRSLSIDAAHSRLTPDELDVLAAMPRLAALFCYCTLDAAAQLAYLKALEQVRFVISGQIDPAVKPGDVLTAAAALPRLRTLILYKEDAPAAFSGDALRAFADVRPCALRELALRGAFDVLPAAAALLCAQRSLQVIEVGVRGDARERSLAVIERKARRGGGPELVLVREDGEAGSHLQRVEVEIEAWNIAGSSD